MTLNFRRTEIHLGWGSAIAFTLFIIGATATSTGYYGTWVKKQDEKIAWEKQNYQLLTTIAVELKSTTAIAKANAHDLDSIKKIPPFRYAMQQASTQHFYRMIKRNGKEILELVR